MEITPDYVQNRFSEMGDFYEDILTPEEEKNGIGMVLFKPDSTNSLLDLPIRDFIQRELEQMTDKPVEFFGFTEIRIKPEDVKKLYPEQKHEEFLKYIQEHFQTGPIGLMLVAAKDAPILLKKLKGSVRTGEGVRGRFGSSNPIDDQTLEAWKNGTLDPVTTKQIGIDLFASNLIHVPDDKDDTKRVMNLLIPKQDLDNLKGSIPFVNRWYSN
ncbi:hypothetical protein A3K29_03940 [Candidatus Collierbacteria bacterium RIFOXYB2_FULL_46_14]|uniref:Nucleoside diphosphate kinase-like domain-containing protein n=1 Tax=Candidatus Collierbacteria bacterium GW2011_GWA2_46_26 TaxID=1618381 RepID=A0A0G1PIP2_9BACT|nr:MAG: hypothetical protein UW29_C0007G0010 [Candidatus Collierbacteria bacterium GW2011_GWC2_44_13]KKU32659.1 MAG: hypothetical protein UX47_C0008G0016 [Candidatus Collierbacteria bacterium GW2011_GWA2_46_26]OGD73264.1 MAG: hypothetical protein A3K29_03940 [Candidatus Collierbacteria bacterium RIFOXYB2_FULL_46_14]OGD76306.1 MAG: hypothetical protein A3K43_03940 [Candidatus Collierbacteria bacterium RIFOXYA2_FULL_46_20]OGD77642.1 MAG: hypothetical protein A3K39_03940 [Candidatus Collierbacteri